MIYERVLSYFETTFQGSTNALSLNHSWSCESMSVFEYSWYPFDVQNCFLHGELPGEVVIKTRFKSAIYSGHHDLGIFVDLSFKRPLTGHFMTLYDNVLTNWNAALDQSNVHIIQWNIS